MNSVFQVTNLPPTSSTACQYSLRTYCQVQQWLENDINPTTYWRTLSNGSLLPLPTDLPPAPDKLMRIVPCNCKAGCIRGCGCRRAGTPCFPICNLCGTRIQQCTGTDWHFGEMTWRMADCWPLGRATAKLVLIVDVAVIKQECPAPLSASAWDLNATVKWQ